VTRHLAIVAKSQPDMIRHDVLQMREALMVENMARDLVDRVIWQSFEETDRRIQARARYMATAAIRGMHDGWEQEGIAKAKQAILRCLKDECGKAFAGILLEEHYDALATILVHAALSAYRGVTEGSIPMTPGDYLRVAQGEQK
jgi:hypothetical protein